MVYHSNFDISELANRAQCFDTMSQTVKTNINFTNYARSKDPFKQATLRALVAGLSVEQLKPFVIGNKMLEKKITTYSTKVAVPASPNRSDIFYALPTFQRLSVELVARYNDRENDSYFQNYKGSRRGEFGFFTYLEQHREVIREQRDSIISHLQGAGVTSKNVVAKILSVAARRP